MEEEFDVPNNGSCLYYAVALSILLPTCGNKEQFNSAYANLFGPAADEEAVDTLQNELANYDGTPEYILDHAVVFQVLIEMNFRTRIVARMGDPEYKAKYLHIYNQHYEDQPAFQLDEAGFSAYLDRQNRAKSWGGNAEIAAMHDVLGVRLQVQTTRDARPLQLSPPDAPGPLVKLVFAGGEMPGQENHYHFIIETQYIPKAISTQIVPGTPSRLLWMKSTNTRLDSDSESDSEPESSFPVRRTASQAPTQDRQDADGPLSTLPAYFSRVLESQATARAPEAMTFRLCRKENTQIETLLSRLSPTNAAHIRQEAVEALMNISELKAGCISISTAGGLQKIAQIISTSSALAADDNIVINEILAAILNNIQTNAGETAGATSHSPTTEYKTSP